MGVLGLLQDFSGWTSAHGIPQIGGARNWPVRIIWTTIFLGAFSMFVFQVSDIVTSYMAFGIYVSTSIQFDMRPFPVITLCNRNPYKRSMANLDSDMKVLLDDFEESITQGSVTSSPDIYKFNNQSDNLEVISHAYNMMTYLSSKWTDKEVDERGYQLTDIILECSFGETKCDLEALVNDFVKIRDPFYGLCWQFNNVDPPTYVAARPGEDFGLKMLLKNDQSEFLPMTESAAFRITVHNQKIEAFPDAFGYVAAAGYVNSFAIKSARTLRLPVPYPSACTSDSASVGTFYYKNSDYSMEACFRSCYQKYIIDACQCADPRFAGPEGQAFCSVNTYSCVEDLETKTRSGGEGAFDVIKDCDCPKPCNDTTYGIVSTQAYWPSLVHKFDMCHNISLWMPYFNDTSNGEENWEIKQADHTLDCIDLFHDQTTVVHVYFDQLTYQMYEENPSYGIQDVVFNFGGQIGLWMGFSVITMIEWVGLSMLIAMYCCAKARGPNVGDMTDEGAHEKDINEIDEILEGVSDDEDDSDDDSEVDPYDLKSEKGDAPPKPM